MNNDHVLIDNEVSTGPSQQTKMRWFFWNKLVESGRKHSYAGLPEPVVTRIERSEDGGAPVLFYDYSLRDGRANAISRRRAKNRVAKVSRKANRGR